MIVVNGILEGVGNGLVVKKRTSKGIWQNLSLYVLYDANISDLSSIQ
ncbi:hypothetical protein N9Y26_00580 [bacterium]|nr:hypothetical protein [bacterium]